MHGLNMTWVVAVALLLLAPVSDLAAATVCRSFPDDKDANTNNVPDDSNPDVDATLTFRLALKKGMTNVNTNPNRIVNLVGGESGAEVAALGAKALCTAAVLDWDYGCQGIVGGQNCNGALDQMPAIGNIDCCNLVTPTANLEIYCYDHAVHFGDRFKIVRTPGPTPFEKFEITGSKGNVDPDTLKHDGGLIHTVKTDMLPQYCLRIDRGSPEVNGSINVSVDGGPSAGSFSVNSNGLSDESLHRAIVAGFNALPGGGLGAILLPNAAGKCRFADSYQGPTVFIPNVHAKQVTGIGVGGVQGQRASVEDSLPGGNIPTLSEWGLIFLAAILSISAIWMLRRRSQTGSPA